MPRWGHRACWGRVGMETRSLMAPGAPRHTWVGTSSVDTGSSHCRCRACCLMDLPLAVPPGKTGDMEAGDTVGRYSCRFRGWDTSGSPGCLVQGGGLSSWQGNLGQSHSLQTFSHKRGACLLTPKHIFLRSLKVSRAHMVPSEEQCLPRTHLLSQSSLRHCSHSLCQPKSRSSARTR